jgi:hypothetical protein
VSDAITVALITGFFGLVAIPTGLYLKRHFDLQDRREAEEEREHLDCIRHKQGYMLAVEQLRSVGRCVIAMGHLKEDGEDAAFEFGWAQLLERCESMEYDFLTMVDAAAREERRELQD